ncbi:hypothetical protein FRUB_10430 [Fimbriiglobus ruber]|uniref:DUF1559 domain-containing protein n=2 Tax=Fimbriiglobus ruber TaxID=1908690 RepID=A0A225DBD0_9BACT|nr:hypothetical protein FRUB_10430 [Fimbriiglobus ruber]
MGFPAGSMAQPAVPKPDVELRTDLSMIPSNAFGFIHVRVADAINHESVKVYRQVFAKAGPKALAILDKEFVPPMSTVEAVTAVMLPIDQNLHNNPFANHSDEPLIGIVTYSTPFDPAVVRAAYMSDAVSKKVAGRAYYVDGQSAAYFPNKTTIVFGNEKHLPRFLSGLAKPANEVHPAAREASGKLAYAHMSGQMVSFILEEKLGNDIPVDLKPLTKIQSATLSLELGQSVKATAKIACAAPGDTAEVEKALKKVAEMARIYLKPDRIEQEQGLSKKASGDKYRPIEELPEVMTHLTKLAALNLVDEILADPPVVRTGNVLTTSVTAPAWVTPYVGLAVAAAGSMFLVEQTHSIQTLNTKKIKNLKFIGVAMHDHDSLRRCLPGDVEKDGKKLLSWRVRILPYIEQQPLYNQFKLDEPWDSEHNKKVLETHAMPSIYAIPGVTKEGEKKTPICVFSGNGAVFTPFEKTSVRDITDGTSNTLMAVHAAKAIPWTKPEDIEFDPRADPTPFLLYDNKGAMVLLADGSVRTLRKGISPESLRKLITRAGGETPDKHDE